MKSKDKRMKSTSEILKNMRILKLQGREMKFLSKIIKLRGEEEGALKKYIRDHFRTCLLVGIPLESGKVLSTLATFKILEEPIYNLPDSISIFFQTKVSLDRIATFLRTKDIDSNAITKLHLLTPTLKDINIRVNQGMRVAVCGTVGSGKSSLLSCILGEVSKISGSVKVEGIKGKACSLKKDLEVLSFGDQTVIGERGINLSGGQKHEDYKSHGHFIKMLIFIFLMIHLAQLMLIQEVIFLSWMCVMHTCKRLASCNRCVIRHATHLFHKMHFAIFRSPMSFFDSTPSGRILNRAAWQAIIIVIPIAGMCIWLQQYYLPSAREMARIAGVCKGPVVQNFSETISGATTIRSFDQQARFQNINLKLNDDFSRPKFYLAAAREWLAFHLDMPLKLLVLYSQGIAGVAATYGLTLSSLQGWIVWNLTDLTKTRLFRLKEYFSTLLSQVEPPLVIESNRPYDQWPSQGEVDIRHLQELSEANLDPLEEYTDDKIWEALDKCQLGDEVRVRKESLIHQDGMIQQTLGKHFIDSTVIMIAHRITSVLDSDMVLVLEQGLVDEYDSPKKLLEDDSSSFAKLVAEYSMRSNSSIKS
ncbi:putative ABC-type xenobiotic transporter [Helianthus annuus]|nr:putative ABC-type xenobiotic transporter [Helianthus annuus]